MKTDIQIAQEATMLPIKDVAASIGIEEDDLELYGKYKAKISDELINRTKKNPDGKLILVTAINPTPAGEGKTTTSVGLGEAFGRLGKKALIALREPSLGPCFGIKGGAAGGGYAQVVPMEDLNLHFTGDFHAITSANNLLAALLDNHIQQGNELGIDPRQIVWKRCMDMNDRVLRNIVVGLGSKMDGMVREDHFVITVASEIMAILCLADDMADLKKRLGRIIVAYTFDGKPVTADDLQATGSMAAETDFVEQFCKERGCEFALSEVWEKGGEGGIDLANKVLETIEHKESNFKVLYDDSLSLKEKIETVAKEIYGADGVTYSPAAERELKRITDLGMGDFPVCMAKTQYSLSDDAKKLGRPSGFKINVREVYASAGAGFVVAVNGSIMTMPGLSKKPAAYGIDVDDNGVITGLF